MNHATSKIKHFSTIVAKNYNLNVAELLFPTLRCNRFVLYRSKAARLFKPRKKLCLTIWTVFEETIKHFLYIVYPLPLPPKLTIETEEEKAVNDV